MIYSEEKVMKEATDIMLKLWDKGFNLKDMREIGDYMAKRSNAISKNRSVAPTPKTIREAIEIEMVLKAED